MVRFALAIGLLLGSVTLASAQSDVAAGEALFVQRCLPCHIVGEAAGADKVGPPLNAIVGAPIGAIPGYRYSDALHEANVRAGSGPSPTCAATCSCPKSCSPAPK